MVLTVASLAPRIRAILLDPDTDLATVSAKRVRKALAEREPAVAPDFIRANKEEVDSLIASVFESVSAATAPDALAVEPSSPPPPSSQPKRKRESPPRDDDDGEDGSTPRDDDSDTRKKAKAKKAKGTGRTLTDEELARQLSAELNANPARTSNGGGKRGPSRTPKRVKKSRATIGDDSDDAFGAESEQDSDGSVKKKKRAKKSGAGAGGGGGGGGGKGGGFQKPLALSPPLAEVLGADRLSRPQVVKKLWEHIHAHDLQNPKNRKQILCDGPLRAVFKTDKVDMFTMNKLLKDHLSAVDE